MGPEGQKKAAEADAALHAKELSARVNQYVRWMLSPDKALRQRGKDRLQAMVKEQGMPELPKLIAQVEAYAAAGDRLAAAYDGGGVGVGGGSSSSVLAECRIQFARLKRPIDHLTTSLGSSAGGSPVTIQLPELEVIVSTTVRIPAGVKDGNADPSAAQPERDRSAETPYRARGPQGAREWAGIAPASLSAPNRPCPCDDILALAHPVHAGTLPGPAQKCGQGVMTFAEARSRTLGGY